MHEMYAHVQLFLFYFFMFAGADPNFVLVLTDDQDLILNGMIPMKKTLELVANRGKVFENAFVNSPICCPNRGVILTGKYAHNTGVVNNSIEGNCSSESWQKYQEPFTIASLLKNEKDYVTFYAGKYLNQYGVKKSGGISHVPEGYDWWFGLKGNSKYYNYTLSVNGSEIFHSDDYLTDLLANYSMDFLNNKPPAKPFFMTIATPAAHAPFIPARRHEHAFPEAKAVRSPSFNYTPIEKHWIVDMPPIHLPSNVALLDDIQKRRLQSLLAVDELMEKMVNKLEDMKLLENTYIIFTSDNGFHIGQFTQPWDKRQPYDTDIRVPLIVSGPNVPKKSMESYPVSSVDLAPTILELANIKVPQYMDGRSFKEVLLSTSTKVFEKRVFVEYWGEGQSSTVDPSCSWRYDVNVAECSAEQWCKCQDARNNTYSCVLSLEPSQKFKFCRFKDSQHFVEAYNLSADPHELTNVYFRMKDDVVQDYFRILDRFDECSGENCE